MGHPETWCNETRVCNGCNGPISAYAGVAEAVQPSLPTAGLSKPGRAQRQRRSTGLRDISWALTREVVGMYLLGEILAPTQCKFIHT